MAEKKDEEKKEQPVRRGLLDGLAKGLWDFLKLLDDMEKKGETLRTVSGEVEGPFYSKAVYDYSVKLGIEDRDFPAHSRRGFRPRPRPRAHVRSIKAGATRPRVINPENLEPREPLVDVFDKGDHIAVVAELPHVKEEDIKLEVVDNVLKITADTPEGKIEKDVSVPEGSEVEEIKDASFKNGILEIKLSKKKRR